MKLLLFFLVTWGLASLVMAAVWAVQRRQGNAGIVDVAWTFAVGSAGVAFALLGEGAWERRLIVGAIAGLWSLRLGSHILHRVLHEPEDGRYQELKAALGDRAQRGLFRFYQYQAFGVALFSLPMLMASANTAALSWIDALGLAVALVSWGGEAIADGQLRRFRMDPANRGQVCERGLWRYSRHPNYFFEWLHWWAYVLLSWGSLWLVAFALIGPLAMYYFIVWVTGIPPTERQALRSRGEAYRRYQARTSPFIPWPPKREGEQA